VPSAVVGGTGAAAWAATIMPSAGDLGAAAHICIHSDSAAALASAEPPTVNITQGRRRSASVVSVTGPVNCGPGSACLVYERACVRAATTERRELAGGGGGQPR
jgi:hypothetical protein